MLAETKDLEEKLESVIKQNFWGYLKVAFCVSAKAAVSSGSVAHLKGSRCTKRMCTYHSRLQETGVKITV